MLTQRISRTRIRPGFTVISEAMPGVSSVSLGFWMNQGSRDETPAQMGLSHLYEHMVFKGTKTRSPKDIACVLEKSGGSINAFTSKEQICLYARFVDNDLPQASELIQDIFHNSLFSATELEKEKNVVLEEISAAEDNPEEFVHDRLFGCLWPNHSLGFPIAGLKANVRGFSQKDLIEFSRKILSSDLVVSAAGNVRHDELCRYFKQLALNHQRRTKSRSASPNLPGVRRFFGKDIQQANAALGFRVGSFTDEDKYPLFVYNALLGDGMSSRLFQRIREELGLVYSIYSFNEAYQDTGMLGVFFGTEPGQLPKALKQVMKEMLSLAQGEITSQELNFAKSYIKGNVLLGMENTGNRMGQLARSEIYLGRAEAVNRTLKRIDQVTVADIRRVCSKYLTNRNLAAAVAAPSSRTLKKIVSGVHLR